MRGRLRSWGSEFIIVAEDFGDIDMIVFTSFI